MNMFGKSFNSSKKELEKKPMIMRCWSCNELFDSNKVKWSPRKLSMPLDNGLGTADLGLDLGLADTHIIFGYEQHELIGNCPHCQARINCLFRGVQEPKLKDAMVCCECHQDIIVDSVPWYSIYRMENGVKVEYMVCVCPFCKCSPAYPNYKPESKIIAEFPEPE